MPPIRLAPGLRTSRLDKPREGDTWAMTGMRREPYDIWQKELYARLARQAVEGGRGLATENLNDVVSRSSE
jgi:hypothetical protein